MNGSFYINVSTRMNLLLCNYILLTLICSLTNASSDVDCAFEGNQCQWKVPSGAQGSWILEGSGSNVNPGHDHTCHDPAPIQRKCQWLSTTTNYSGTQEFILYSPEVEPSSKPGCLSFWYHYFVLDRNSWFELDTNSKPNTFGSQALWERRVASSNGWVQAWVTIPPHSGPLYLIFRAMITSTFHDTVGLDDIYYFPDHCPRTIDCDFELGPCEWKLNKASLTNGTFSDHTLQTSYGHYVLAKGRQNSATIQASIANITFGHLSNDHYYCLRFWYLMNIKEDDPNQSFSFIKVSDDKGRGQILIDSRVVAKEGRTYTWNEMIYSTYAPDLTIDLVIQMYTVDETILAIDDVTLLNEKCQPFGDCDFENDLCGWTTRLWLRSSGGNSLRNEPDHDMTTGTPNGWFAVVPIEYMQHYGTAVLSSPFMNYNQNHKHCFSMFYWAVGRNTTVTVLEVDFVDLTQLKTYDKLLLKASNDERWQRVEYQITRLPPLYSVQIYTTNIGQLLSDVAVDQIQFTEQCSHSYTTPRPTPEPASEKLWDTDFEWPTSYRNWQFDSSWKVTSFREGLHQNAPRRDHTKNTADGHYLLWLPSKTSNGDQPVNSTLHTSKLSGANNQVHCFSFWYYDATERSTELTIYSHYKNQASRELSLRPNIVTLKWRVVKIDFYVPNEKANESWIELMLTTHSNLQATFAIDDIRLQPGRCPHMDGYLYTMDQMDNLQISHIEPFANQMGIFYKPSTYYKFRFPNAPTKDHTTGDGGYFLFMQMPPNLMKPNLYATHNWLIVDEVSDDTQCIQFAYQKYGNVSLSMGVAPLDGQSKSTYFIAEIDHRDWVLAQVYHSSRGMHRVVFDMTMPQNDSKSYIALDDVMLKSGKCPQPITCDFEDDSCAFETKNDKHSDYAWARFIAPPITDQWPGPPYDHTLRIDGGGYLYMSGFPSKQDMQREAQIESAIRYSDSDTWCLSFWSYLSDTDAQLTLQLRLYHLISTKDKVINLLSLTNLKESQWTQHYVDFNSTIDSGYREFTLLLTGRTSKANTIISVDDIDLEMGQCDSQFTFTCKTGNQKFGINKVCDFRSDCNDGSDELLCGNCDFERDDTTSTCGWQNTTSRGFEDPIFYRASAQWRVGPKTDGSDNAKGHYMLLNSDYGQAVLVHNTTNLYAYKQAYFTCQISFDYYISAANKNHVPWLELLSGNTDDSSVRKVYLQNSTGMWKRATAFTGAYSGKFTVKFVAQRYVNTDVVAIDNIRFEQCSVPPPQKQCTSSGQLMCKNTRVCIDPTDQCDFENNCGDNWDESFELCSPFRKASLPRCDMEISLDFCGFGQTQNNHLSWRLRQGNEYNPQFYSGPSADHTTNDLSGQFAMLYLQEGEKELAGKHVELIAPMMTATGGDCVLRFFFYNNGRGNNANRLSVRARFADESQPDSALLFDITSYTERWVKAKVHFRSAKPFQFVLDGSLANHDSSIAIDDVSFWGNCQISNEKRSNKDHKKSIAVIVVVVLLFVVGFSVAGYFIYTRKFGGEISLGWLTSRIPWSNHADRSSIVKSGDNQ